MKNSTLLKIVWAISLLLIVTIPFTYYCNVNDFGTSNKPEQWGQFGHFFGGILNPLLSILNLIVLTYLSIRLVKDDDNRNKFTLQELARPYGDITFDRKPWSITIAIENCGLGPMIITEIIVKHDGGSTYNNFSPIAKAKDEKVAYAISAFRLNNHCVISKDKEQILLNIEGNKTDENYLNYIKDIDQKLKNYTIPIKYEDMYGRKLETPIERIKLSFIDDE